LVKIEGNTEIKMGDSEEFSIWEALGTKVRVVGSEETRTLRRKLMGKEENETPEWM